MCLSRYTYYSLLNYLLLQYGYSCKILIICSVVSFYLDKMLNGGATAYTSEFEIISHESVAVTD